MWYRGVHPPPNNGGACCSSINNHLISCGNYLSSWKCAASVQTLFIYFENSNSCYLHRHLVLNISYSGIKSLDICWDSYLDLCVIPVHMYCHAGYLARRPPTFFKKVYLFEL